MCAVLLRCCAQTTHDSSKTPPPHPHPHIGKPQGVTGSGQDVCGPCKQSAYAQAFKSL